MARFNAPPLVYEIADRFVESALRRDDSLFTPGRAIWTLQLLDELDAHYVQRPDLGEGGFEEKLQSQLAGASPAAIQLMAEILFVYYLPAHYNIAGATKRQKLQQVLSWMPEPVGIPADLLEVTDYGIGSGGVGFHSYKWASITFLITFARRWKQSSQGVRSAALTDPWRFREFVAQIPTDGGGIYGREALLHLVFPDAFERIFSGADKWRLADTLKALVDDPSANVDARIAQIRTKLEHRFGPGFDFYEADGARALWKRYDNPVDEFVYWASRFHELPEFVPEELTYKLEIVRHLSEARSALLADADWFPPLKRAFGPPNNLTNWRSHDTVLKWLDEDRTRGAKLLRRLWDGDDDPLDRLGDFLSHLPSDVLSGLGTRTTFGSFLLMALGPDQYPPYRTAAMHAAYRLAKFDPGDEKDEVSTYRAGLAFLDTIRERATQRGLSLKDRLEAQSVTWCIASWPVPGAWPSEDQAAFERYRHGVSDETDEEVYPPEEPGGGGGIAETPFVDPLVGLADELLMELRNLREIEELLRSKRQIIIYGPPGTGKTYVAQRLALALAGDRARVRLVQFHPSYAYEDFIEGYRPTLANGVAGFELRSGPMKSLAEAARDDPGRDYFLIVDELNRGNIAKVFGELYFLLEYRDEEMMLQYSTRAFRLPTNLYLIGTMNTADRSIALLDAALRRRFAFVPFFPDIAPIAGLLGRWLQRHRPEMSWVAGVVDAANAKLADRNTAIGPSFFMNKELNEARLDRVWRYEILPLLEDHFFESPERLKDFALDRLRKGGDGVFEDSAAEPPLDSPLANAAAE